MYFSFNIEIVVLMFKLEKVDYLGISAFLLRVYLSVLDLFFIYSVCTERLGN